MQAIVVVLPDLAGVMAKWMDEIRSLPKLTDQEKTAAEVMLMGSAEYRQFYLHGTPEQAAIAFCSSWVHVKQMCMPKTKCVLPLTVPALRSKLACKTEQKHSFLQACQASTVMILSYVIR